MANNLAEIERGQFPTAEKAASLSRFYQRNERWIIGSATVLSFLLLWEAFTRSGAINPILLSSPTDVARAGAGLFASGEIWKDLWVSGVEFAVGFGLSVLLGIPLGLAVGWYRRLHFALDPFLSALYATPRVALLPLIIIWLGIGIWSKIAIVFLGAFFPICVNTIAGVKTSDARLLRVAQSFGASELRVFTSIVLPSSVPFILSGLRLGVGRALIGVVVGELYAATAGIGFMITVAGATFQTDKVFVGIVILALFGVFCVELLTRLERRFETWRPKVGAAI
jgi:NitT/TauT family transport system permease protein